MHGHGSSRSEKVHSNVFWCETKSRHSHLPTLRPDDGDDVGCADGAEAMIRGEIADGGGDIASLVAQAKEDVNACLDWEGCNRLRTEVGDSITVDGIILIVEGDNNLVGLAEMLGGGVPGEEKVPDKEHKVHEEPELDRPTVAGALCVFAGTEAELESTDDQADDVVRSGVR